MPAEIEILIAAQVAQAVSAIESVGQSTQKMQDGVSKTGKNLATAFAAGAIVKYGKSAITAADDAAAAQRVTAQLITQTGAAAWTSSGHIDTLTSSLKQQTAVSGGTIRSAENLLLTFKNVQNAGEGTAAIFDRATAASLDLAATGFGDAESSAKMLGKALNDPVAGLTALSRAGVQFTAAQKQQITAMVQAGDTLGAQKIILAEVESQVGGTAAASVTASDQMSMAYKDTQKALGEGLLPVFQAFVPIVTFAAGVTKDYAGIIAPFIATVFGLVAALKAWSLIQAIVNVLVSANPIGIVILAIGALIGVILALVMNWDKVVGVLSKAWDWFKIVAAVLTAPLGVAILLVADHLDVIVGAFHRVLDVMGKVKDAAGAVGGALSHIPGLGKAAPAPGLAGYAPTSFGVAAYAGGGGFAGVTVRPVTINVTTPFGSDPYRLGDAITRALARYESRNGQLTRR